MLDQIVHMGLGMGLVMAITYLATHAAEPIEMPDFSWILRNNKQD